jgi:CubicO group peptidase (beta-lactamase class C family)
MDFPAVDAALQAAIDGQQLTGVSYAVFRGHEVLARKCLGYADREAGVPVREDHLFRAFSNTKLVTSCAALQLVEQGRLRLDDPVGQYIPALKDLRVLRPGATSVEDTVPAREPVRIRHLLTHTAGFTYAFTQPDAPIAAAYRAARVLDPALDLAHMMDALAGVPLLFEPGTAWNYSVATDIVGRVVEVVAGQKLDDYFRQHIFAPLCMHDTFFSVPPEKQQRLAALYIGSLKEPLRPGLHRADNLPYQGAYRKGMPFLGGGGGLVTSLDDYGLLVRALLRGGAPLLRPETMALVTRNQLPEGMWLQFPGQPLFLDRAGHARHVVLDEERVDEGHRQRAEQRAGHQRAPVVDVAFHQFRHHADRHGLVLAEDTKVSA